MKKFETNKTYKMTFIGDSELIVPVTVTRRTEKTVWFKIRNGGEKRAKLHIYDGSEYFYPEGSNYSMAPSCYAKKEY